MDRPEMPLSHQAARELLLRYRIPLAREELVASAAEAAASCARVGFPLVLKGLSSKFTHKTEAGLVRLNLTSPPAVERAANQMTARLGGALEGFLLQEQVTGGIELIAGIVSDPLFGPMLLVGSGGTLVELTADAVLGLPPLTRRQLTDLLKQTRSWKLLEGFRVSPPGDIPALLDLLANLGRLALEQRAQVSTLDLNPILVLPEGQGVRVVDYRIFGR